MNIQYCFFILNVLFLQGYVLGSKIYDPMIISTINDKNVFNRDQDNKIITACVSPDEKYIAIAVSYAGSKTTIHVLDLQGDVVKSRSDYLNENVQKIQWIDSSKGPISIGDSGSIFLWCDLNPNSNCIKNITISNQIKGIIGSSAILDSSNQHQYLSIYGSKMIYEYDITSSPVQINTISAPVNNQILHIVYTEQVNKRLLVIDLSERVGYITYNRTLSYFNTTANTSLISHTFTTNKFNEHSLAIKSNTNQIMLSIATYSSSSSFLSISHYNQFQFLFQEKIILGGNSYQFNNNYPVSCPNQPQIAINLGYYLYIANSSQMVQKIFDLSFSIIYIKCTQNYIFGINSQGKIGFAKNQISFPNWAIFLIVFLSLILLLTIIIAILKHKAKKQANYWETYEKRFEKYKTIEEIQEMEKEEKKIHEQ